MTEETRSAKVSKKVQVNETAKRNGQSQTELDVSKGNIVIKSTGASGGGLAADETSLNPEGYHITGTTTKYNIVVERNVTTKMVLDNAITKDGKDGRLVIQCESADEHNHRCDSNCGTLTARGNKSLYHAEAGYHSPGIGGACTSNYANGKVENLSITGGNIKAIGNVYCSGIGGGGHADIDGISISGGVIEAIGGKDAPGIGSVDSLVKNILISGGDTVVVAEGDSVSNAPGIGFDKTDNNQESIIGAVNVTASPDTGYQGYIQGKFYTKVYFGSYRDENTIEKDTKEQIGANHVISKTGGDGFTGQQLIELAKVKALDENGVEIPKSDLKFSELDQIELINKVCKMEKSFQRQHFFRK